MKLIEITPKFVDNIPEKLEEGVLYISLLYKVAIHLCACGCGGKTVTPLGAGEWGLTNNDGKISLTPSIGNWADENKYHAHYFITNNKINWC